MRRRPDEPIVRHGLARVLSKMGLASRTVAAQWIRDGRVSVNGRVVRDPEFPTRMPADRVLVADQAAVVAERVYVMLNKPRGLVTTTRDERGRATVYQCFAESGLPWLAPVGRLDQASEGLLLFSNDPGWAAAITEGSGGHAITKTYHVQIDRIPDADLLAALRAGVVDAGEALAAVSVAILRQGDKNAWLEIVLDEGRNRQIRRLLAAHDVTVLRLIRIAVGGLALGTLAKGHWRRLTESEALALAPVSVQR
ncbi:pseudouridine synthase [Ahniella affigens]|uniref:Pseudouridine synthase n=1 Tax=Ahniella affigens TaxID=2021234 RepID=A0A2P1PNW3_9GAMM|nr:pseudouridine synthase [Ahniella affigens]AVP96528.1 pseudouridine synthase [Ahniella affigens]